MKIFVTGGCGFIGQNLIYKLLEEGHKVLNLDLMTYSSDETIKDRVNDNYSFFYGDIVDEKKVREILNDEKPDALFNLAAETHVDRSIDDPFNFIRTNVLGTCNLLKCSSEYHKTNSNFIFYHCSTDEVFGSLSRDEKPFTEKSRYDPSSPYSASKASADHFVNAWHKTYNLPTLISNCSNNYGPFQFPEKLIPRTIIRALLNQPIEIYGDGKNVRDWIYVKDHINGMLMVLEDGAVGESYNIGGNCEKTNLEVVQKICTILNKIMPKDDPYENLITFVKDRPGHDFRYAIDSSKIEKEIEFSPEHSFDSDDSDKSAIEQTIKWYIENKSWWERLISNENLQRRGILDCSLNIESNK